MQVICISRCSDSQGKELAEQLAGKLGHECLGREDLVEAATKAGIAVGKLEAAMLKPQVIGERLMLEKEHFQAFATAFLCERALRTNLVYHGRTGHLLLPGISHVLRIRVAKNVEARIEAAMNRLNVPWEKARKYVEQVDDDTRRWVKTFYAVDWDAHTHYDVVINLDQMSVGNAAAALTAVAALPDFQTTPASIRAMKNLLLAARVRVALARHERTHAAAFRVSAIDGEVLVTYQPRDSAVAEAVPAVLRGLEGVLEVRCTMASTNILWIEERYQRSSETYDRMVKLARRWNAAVELLRYLPAGAGVEEFHEPVAAAAPPSPAAAARHGGIEDDAEGGAPADDGGLREVHDALSADGVAGGAHAACCSANRLLERLGSRGTYTLAVVGGVFLDKGHAARTRMTRELSNALGESLKVPVVDPTELRRTYMFGAADAVKMVLFLLISAAVALLVFTNQEQILSFVRGQDTGAKVLSSAAVVVAVPLFAYVYGTFARLVLKLLRVE
jgi:hypothetical protein